MNVSQLLGATAALVVFATAGAAQDELLFPLEEAPAEALAAAQAAAPDVTFAAVDLEIEDGVVTLEFTGARADGQIVEVDVSLSVSVGEVLEVEEVIPFSTVPQNVRDTLAIAMGAGFEPTSVEKSMRGELVVYEFEGVDENGLAVDVEVQSDGESAVILDDEET